MAWLMWWERVVFSGSDRFSTLKNSLGLGDAAGGQGDGTGLFIDDVVGVNMLVLFLLVVHGGLDQAGQAGGKVVGQGVELGGLLAHAGDDQGGPGLVDEDGVHLVHDGEGRGRAARCSAL